MRASAQVATAHAGRPPTAAVPTVEGVADAVAPADAEGAVAADYTVAEDAGREGSKMDYMHSVRVVRQMGLSALVGKTELQKGLVGIGDHVAPSAVAAVAAVVAAAAAAMTAAGG